MKVGKHVFTKSVIYITVTSFKENRLFKKTISFLCYGFTTQNVFQPTPTSSVQPANARQYPLKSE